MTTCVPYGWGTGPWGTAPWGGSLIGSPGGPLPTVDPFDIFCVGPCGPMSYILTYDQVSTIGPGSLFGTEPNTLDLLMFSGGTAPSDQTGAVIFSVPVTPSYTLEWTLKGDDLPPDFFDISSYHVFIGAANPSGNSAGLFLSQIGVCYSAAPYFDSNDVLHVGTVAQLLPGSQLFISENTYYTFRLVVDGILNVTYVYITKTEELGTIGHQLRYVLPGISSELATQVPVEGALISFKGTASKPTSLALDNICLGSGLVIPNLPPVADAGIDQAIQKCTVARLDGRASYDPEGSVIKYKWRLVSAPITSGFLFEGADGYTVPEPSPTGFTNKFRSDELYEVHQITPIVSGTVLAMMGSYWVLNGTVSTDLTGPYFELTTYTLPDNLSGPTSFEILYQGGIAEPTSAQPTFYPDVVGIFKFELTVFDGLLYSKPAYVIYSVTESTVPRGVIPDAGFIWGYLSDFWRQVDEKDAIDIFWSALLQVAASEMLTLWQLDYNKSLRDIQRTFQRRWLHYDLRIPEPLIESTSIRALWGGIYFGDFPVEGTTVASGSVLIVESPVLENPFTVTFPAGVLTGFDIYDTLVTAGAAFDSRIRFTLFTDRVPKAAVFAGTVDVTTLTYGPGGTVDGLVLSPLINGVPFSIIFNQPASPVQLLIQINTIIGAYARATLGPNNELVFTTNAVGAAQLIDTFGGAAATDLGLEGPAVSGADFSYQRIRMEAPFPLTVGLGSSTPSAYFPQGLNGVHPRGISGALVAISTYRTEYPLAGLGIVEDDVLVLDEVGYRIARIVDDPSDPWPYQRIVLKEAPTAQTLTQSAWHIPAKVKSRWIDFYNALVTEGDYVTFEIIDQTDASLQYIESYAQGACAQLPDVLLVDLSPIAVYLNDTRFYQCYFADVTRRKYMPLDSLVQSIPYLQEKINNAAVGTDAEVLRMNVDFFIETFRGKNCIRFVVAPYIDGDVWEMKKPPARLWAETTYLDNKPAIEANFGVPVDFTLTDFSAFPSNADYLSIVRGLWYSCFNGPTLYNLRVGAQILLGLPFAEEAGSIVEINYDFSPTRSRILIQDNNDAAIVRSYTWPRPLLLDTNPNTGKAYALNDTVERFAPLVSGVGVVDYIKDPKWFVSYVEQGVFLEPEKLFRFLVRVDSAAFDLTTLLFMERFVLKMKPTFAFPLFVVQAAVGESDLTITDATSYRGKLYFEASMCGSLSAYTFDQPDPSPGAPGKNTGHTQVAADTNTDDTAPLPTPNTPDLVDWGMDAAYWCPEDAISLSACVTYAVPTKPQADSIYAMDTGVFIAQYAQFVSSLMHLIPAAGRLVGPSQVATTAGTVTTVRLAIEGNAGDTDPSFLLVVVINGTEHVMSPSFDLPASTAVTQVEFATSLSVGVGNTVEAILRPKNGVDTKPGINVVEVVLGATVAWYFDTDLPAGTYCTYKAL